MAGDRNHGISFRKLVAVGLYLAPFLCFALLLALAFFTSPAAEDLAVHYYDRLLGTGDNIRQFYHQSSRYFSYPLLFVLLEGRFFMEHYFVIALALLTGLWSVLYWLSGTVMGILSDVPLPARRLLWLATTFLVSMVSILFEPASVIYWISGSLIYLLPFLLFLLLLGLLFRTMAKGRASGWELTGGGVLTVALTGGNEIVVFFLLIMLCWIQLIYREMTGKWFWLANGCLLVLLLCIGWIILPGGATSRAGHFQSHRPVLESLSVAILCTGRLLYRMSSSPLLWLCLTLSATMGVLTRIEWRARLAASRWLHPLVGIVLALAGTGCFYFFIYFFSGELLPPRANGMIEWMVFLFGMAAACSWGARLAATDTLQGILRSDPLIILFGLLLFLGSQLPPKAAEDLFTGVVYRRIMEQRTERINEAKRRGERNVPLNSYQRDYQEMVDRVAPSFVRRSLIRRGALYPSLIFYQDPLADTALYIHYFAEFNGIDTIWYEGRPYDRVGLMQNKGLQ